MIVGIGREGASPGGVVGRGEELGALDSFLDAARGGFAVLAIEGEAGIGKTAVWKEGVRLAREGGLTVLDAVASEADTGLSFVGLADLFDPIGDDLLDGVPPPQRDAVSAALLHRPVPGTGLDERALSAAVLTLLRMLASEGPLLVAVDDAQWLDSASARVLSFAARRLETEHVGLFVTVRSVGAPLASFDQAADPPRRTRLALGPLSVAALHELIKGRTGRALPRPLMVKIAEVCAGNPFYALEIAAGLARDPSPAEGLPVPASLGELLASRIAALPPPAREALVVCAMLSRPTPELVDVDALEEAERSGIVTVEQDQIRFSHPLLASAACQQMSPSDRRRVHRRLAGLAKDREERARHLALGAVRPDERIAAELDAAGASAATRGAPQSAGELAELALRLTPGGQSGALARRKITGAGYWFEAGDLIRAQSLLEEAVTTEPPGDLRAGALALLAQIHFRRSSFDDAVSRTLQARQEAIDLELQIRLELDLAFFSINLGDFAGCARHARTAAAATPNDAHPAMQSQVLAVLTIAEFLCGRGLDEQRLEKALALEDWESRTAWQLRPSFIAGLLYLYSGRPEKAIRTFDALYEYGIERGEEGPIPIHCFYLTWALVWHGELDRAAQVAELAKQTASLVGDPASQGAALTAAALVHAYDGSAALARDEAAEAIAIFQSLNWATGAIFPTWALGLAHGALGDPVAVDATLGPLASMLTLIGEVDSAMAMFLPEEIEALIELGRHDEAQNLLKWLEERARRLERPLSLAAANRCRALWCAARGERSAAFAAIEAGIANHEKVDMPIERARTLLVWGRLLRRSGKRATAREVLTEAVAVFDRVGAPTWSDRARSELARLGGRKAGPDELTPTETLVAELAASGISNREIAERAFLTTKAVEANLTRAYRKLGIRSRAGLARALEAVDAIPAKERRATKM
jgi:DNA-binding CsgD family transcriptional regulator